jgi:hypothetical protein
MSKAAIAFVGLVGLGIVGLAGLAIVALVGAAGPSCCDSSDTTTAAPAADEITQPSDRKTYTCPMHPEVTSEQPGQCPKCGMKLVQK